MLCKRCGAKINNNDYFCVICGTLNPSILKDKSTKVSVKKSKKTNNINSKLKQP